jgi:hypothetical protein
LLVCSQLHLSACGLEWYQNTISGGFSISPATLYQNQTLTGTGWASDIAGDTSIGVTIILDGNGATVPPFCQATMSAPQGDPSNNNWNFSCNIGALSYGSHTIDAYAANGDTGGNIGSTQTFMVMPPPPTPTVSIDGYGSGATITRPYRGSVAVTVRYAATDSVGYLSGIRYNVWNATTGYFDNNGGGFVSQSGTSGEVDKSVTLGSDGTWYFWTDAEDSYGGSACSGAQTSGFKLTVVQAPQPPLPVVKWTSNPASVAAGQPYTISAQATDSAGCLASLSITKNGQPFVSGSGNANTSTASGSTSDMVGSGTVAYSAVATDVYGFVSTATWTVAVNKATPVVSNWPSRAIANNTGYTGTAGPPPDLGAVFSSPYSSSVVQPTGTVTYTIVSDSSGTYASGTPIVVGHTVLNAAIYTVRASYPGDANYVARPVDVTWVISNPVTLATASAYTVYFGQTVTITADSKDKDSLLVSQDIDYLPPPGATWVNGAATWAGGPVGENVLIWTIPTSILNLIGPWQVRASGTNNVGLVSPDLSIASITLSQATPSFLNWSDQTFPTTHIVASADLSATLANPYTSGVAQPTGAVAYSIVSGGSGALTAGTKLYPGTYKVRASYAGDTYYVATTVDVTWNIINHPPVTTLAADVMDIAPGQTVNLTAATTDIDGNLLSQTIDYLPPNSTSWVMGGATWSGAYTGSHTLTWAVPGSILSIPGSWKFRATGGDGIAAPNYNSLTVVVANGITGPTGLKINRPAQ